MPESRQEAAARFRDLHERSEILVLPNAWDVASAVVMAEAGFDAIGTTSAGMAALFGYPDTEGLGLEDVVALVERITAAVEVPVSVDAESGYGDAAETARRLWSAGAVGMNLEDGRLAFGDALENVAAARRAAPDLFINARTDVFWLGGTADLAPEDPAYGEAFDEAVRRGNLFLEAGADAVFVPLVRDAGTIGRLAQDVDGPLNVLGGPGVPPVPELEALGVARVSVGSAVARAGLALVRRACEELSGPGTYGFASEAIPYGELNALLRRGPVRPPR